MGWSMTLSCTDYDLATGRAPFVGAENYASLVTEQRVLLSLGNTFTYALMAVTGSSDSRVSSRSEAAGLEQGPGDVVGEVAEPEG